MAPLTSQVIGRGDAACRASADGPARAGFSHRGRGMLFSSRKYKLNSEHVPFAGRKYGLNTTWRGIGFTIPFLGATDSFQEMKVFAAVVEAGSFTGATHALDMSNATVSRYVGELEQRLDLRLLHRIVRKLPPMTEGEIFHCGYNPMTRVKFNGRVNGPAFAEVRQFESGWQQIVRHTMHVWLNGTNGRRRRVKSS